ncbi:MAG: dipeptide epimerase [Ignavibacteriae bacterium HGW-Ignavibacteriae-2]|jgi:L-alanine-DL-glutamate epimerase-like enolase superfamily enzyme|nr:MAG: dipeptide epimerase [Ignavibacteriae bacterium HGW-Ignavibacteriae-2]
MKLDRRNFIKSSAILGSSALLLPNTKIFANTNIITNSAKKMNLKFKPYTLELKHVFTIATSSRSTTPVMLTEIEYDGVIGYGEASMPPYLGESQETASKFLTKVNLEQFNDPFQLENILEYVDSIDVNNSAAKASIDIALHDLVGKLLGEPWYKIWGYDKSKTPNTSFTIGIDTPEVIKQKVKEAEIYKVIKVKLGRENDKEMIETIRSVTDKPIVADINQGWKEKEKALEMIYWLQDKGVQFVEQPMPKENIDDMAWLTEKSPLPTIADEFLQRLPDVVRAHGVYSGINIKLMKCTGLREAQKMLILAKALGMKVMLGCMTETSCAISAASQLAPESDWADLDGNLLISNDPYEGTLIENGKIRLMDYPGIGLKSL